MRRGVFVGIGGAILLVTTVAGAWADVARGQDLTIEELNSEIARNRALRAYVRRNGLPDIAERRFLADRPPWSKNEVSLYYLDRRQEIGFASAEILGRPDVQIVRYERPISDAQAMELAARAGLLSTPATPGPVGRADAAARRAEDAAARVELAVEPVERLADRTEALAVRAEDGFHRSVRK
jgi:hypothetical protein